MLVYPQTTQVHPSLVWVCVKSDGMAWRNFCSGIGLWTVGIAGDYIFKTTQLKCSIAWVPVESVGLLPKTEPGHSPIGLNHTSLWWGGAGHLHRSKLFYYSGYGHWVSVSTVIIWGARNTGILCPWCKEAVEKDAYGGPKFSSNI